MGDGNGDFLALDQRLILDLDLGIDQLGFARGGKFVADGFELVSCDLHYPGAGG